MKHAAGGALAGVSLTIASALLPMAGFAEGMDMTATTICYSGASATVSANVLGTYLQDGATLGSCADAEKTKPAQAQAAPAAAPQAEAEEDSEEDVTLDLFTDKAEEDEDDGSYSRMSVHESHTVNGRTIEFHEEWEDGVLQVRTSNILPGLDFLF